MSLLSFFRSGATVVDDQGLVQAYSSFGVDQTTTGPDFQADAFYAGERAKLLDFRDAYFTARQHDGKIWNWDCRTITAAHHPAQPLIGASEPGVYIPMNHRRPSAPFRISRIIVNAFTAMLFGEHRFPTVDSLDPDTADFAAELMKVSKLRTRMIQARNFGGANGTAILSWWFEGGRPRVRVHNPRFVHVLKWADADDFEIEHAVELYKYPRTELNPSTKRVEKVYYWHRRDWTTSADVVFRPKKCDEGKRPTPWVIDEERSVIHSSGSAHIVWIQNLPDEDTFSVDGQTDYGENYEPMDELDQLNSVHVGGIKKNLDPTLQLPIDPEDYAMASIQKGSDHAIAIGAGGGQAQYLTLPGDVVTSGKEAVAGLRQQILEATSCVIPDPDKVVASATSSLALKIIYQPMTSKCDIMRDQYGDGIERLLNQMLNVARQHMQDPDAETDEQRFVHEPMFDEAGNPVVDPDTGERKYERIDYRLELESRVIRKEVLDEDGNGTGEFVTREIPRTPGRGRIRLKWPPYFMPTADDRQKETGADMAGTGSKPVLSQESAVRMFAERNGLDPDEELRRVRADEAREMERQAASQGGMWPPFGQPLENSTAESTSDVDASAPSDVESAAPPVEAQEPGIVETDGGIAIELAPTTISKLITANEARRLMRQGPAMLEDGVTPDPAGNLPIDAYALALEERARVASEAAQAAAAPVGPPLGE